MLSLNELMVRNLIDRGILNNKIISDAFKSRPRHLFINHLPKRKMHLAYEDSPLGIGENQTISAPHMVAMMLELLAIEPGDNVLEIGTGSGYCAALCSFLVGAKGHVHTIEVNEQLYLFFLNIFFSIGTS